MAQVAPVETPQVSPQGTQPLQRIDAPAGAFGAPIAQGLGHVGSQLNSAGDVLEKHAEVLQGLANKAASDQASIATDTELGKLYDDYTTNYRGGNAMPAYADFQAK